MTFAWPHLLWLLFAPAALLARELFSRRRREAASHPKILRAEAGTHQLSLVPSPSRGYARKRIWLAAGLALAIIALARPQWGRIDEPVFDQSREIVLAIDLSRSMLTPDVPPSRLDRAKLLVQSLLDRLAGERVGLVVFSGTAFLQSPLSADYEILREFLPALGPDFLPEGGTNYGAMIEAAAGAFEGRTAADRFLVVLSDGGANDADWRDHVGKLTEKGIRVIGLGIGTSAGGFIPDGNGGLMKDGRGAVVLAKLESDTLQELSRKTHGAYRDASGWVDLAELLKSTVDSGRKGRFVEKNNVRYVERFQWALAPALLCLLISFWREFPVRPRPRDLSREGRRAPQAAVVGLVLLAAALLLQPAAMAVTAAALPAPDSSALLGRIVGRLSAQTTTSALDWAELGHQTVTWGRQFQSAHQSVPAGPVRDALAAVDSGSALDAKATDWARLRSDLEGLLQKPKESEQSKQPPQQQQQDQSQRQNSQDQKSPQKKTEEQKSASSPPRGSSEDEQGSERRSPSKSESDRTKSNAGELGDMKPSSPPPSSRPSAGTQRIGGTAAHQGQDPAMGDPTLAIPLQKLDQVRNTDSPGALYQMIENNEPHPPPADQGKNW